MLDRPLPLESDSTLRPPQINPTPTQRRENNEESGLQTAPTMPVSLPKVIEVKPATPAAETALDARQDEIMAVASSDGRPPNRQSRLMEWRWLGVAVGLIVAGGVTWIAIEGVGLAAR